MDFFFRVHIELVRRILVSIVYLVKFTIYNSSRIFTTKMSFSAVTKTASNTEKFAQSIQNIDTFDSKLGFCLSCMYGMCLCKKYFCSADSDNDECRCFVVFNNRIVQSMFCFCCWCCLFNC